MNLDGAVIGINTMKIAGAGVLCDTDRFGMASHRTAQRERQGRSALSWFHNDQHDASWILQ